MKRSILKTILVVPVALIALAALLTWREFPVSAYATEEHGHGHAHEENEESHDTEKEEHGHGHEDEHGHGEEADHAEGLIALDAVQIAAANIKITPAGPGKLSKEVAVPGKIVAAADRMAQIVPKVSGVVTEARKNLGDTVESGDVMAVIESREMAEAVADYLAGKRAQELAWTTFTREKTLWEKKITAEQDYLNARNAHQESKIRLDLARQKLQALGHDAEALKQYESSEHADKLRFHEVRSPLAGRVISRELTLGEYVDTTHTAFTVADLSVVWVETAIAPGDLSYVHEGQPAKITGGGGKAMGKLIFVSPAIDPETRSAKAIIELENKDGHWRAGDFANAAIATSAQDAELIVPKDAVQTYEDKRIVFVRNDQGFERREVTTGREDSLHVEILSGLNFGEPIAVTNTFTLKAELGKAEAGHSHDH